MRVLAHTMSRLSSALRLSGSCLRWASFQRRSRRARQIPRGRSLRAGKCDLTPAPLQVTINILGEKALEQWGKAMIHSSHRERKTKAIAEVLAMIADADPKLAPNHPRPARMSDDWLWEDATEFCAALDRYTGGRACRNAGRRDKSQAQARRCSSRATKSIRDSCAPAPRTFPRQASSGRTMI